MKKLIALLLLVSSVCFGQTFDVQNLVVHGTGNLGSSVTITGGSISGISPPLPQLSGGTGATAGSGTVIDNLSGFAGTGLLNRTGAGAYSFVSLTNGLALTSLTQQAANTVLGNFTGSLANITAFSMPSCSAAANALTYTISTGFTCNTLTASAVGADPIAAATPKAIYVSTAGSDANSGTSWGLPKLTIQAAINAANPGGTVYVGAGTYTQTTTLLMQPRVNVQCLPGATILQNGSFNVLMDWSGNVANGAGIYNCTIDGNWPTTVSNANAILMYVSTANDVIVQNNSIQNGSGSGVEVTSGVRPVITGNKFNNFYVGPIFFITGVGQTVTLGQVVHNTIIGNIGQHAITMNLSDRNIIEGNTITAALQVGMTVNTAGTTVTLTGGPNFSTVSAGSFIILNGGSEFLITSVTDSTHLQVNVSPGTLTGVPAAIGPGDLLSIAASSHNVISSNNIVGGVGGGIVISNFIAGSSTQKNAVVGNILRGQGEGCIELESENAFGTQVFDTTIQANNIANCGVGTTAVAANTRFGIALIDFNPNTLLNTIVDGNYVRDDQGSPTTSNWMSTAGMASGQVQVGNNFNVGMINPGVAGGLISVGISAGWGNAATASGVSYGNGFTATVTSNGTGQSAGPTVTVNTVAASGNPPVMACQFIGGTGAVNFVFGQSPGVNAGPSATLFAFNGTPVAGNTYTFLCKG